MKKFLFLILICSLSNCIQDDEFHSYPEHSLQKKNSIYAREGNELKDTINEPLQEEKGDPPPKEISGNGNKP